MSASGEWNKAHPKECRAALIKWRMAHPERARELARKYNEKRRDKTIALKREWRKNNPEMVRAQHSEWVENNPEKYAAHTALNTAIAAGRITRPGACVCGNNKLEAHHEDYSRPLDVDWLCRNCHQLIHRRRIT